MVDFCFGPFPGPDSAWLPTLGDIEMKKAEGDPNYVNFGFDQLDSNPTRFPLIAERWDTLAERFNERYFYRMINAETLPRWQVRLQNRYDEIAARFEFAYGMYDKYAEQMMARAIDAKRVLEYFTETEITKSTVQQSGTDTVENTGKEIDTPDSIINANDNYADALTKLTGSTTYGRKDEGDTGRGLQHGIDRTESLGGRDIAESIHGAIDAFRDIDTLFVAQFENNFLNIFWYE